MGIRSKALNIGTSTCQIVGAQKPLLYKWLNWTVNKIPQTSFPSQCLPWKWLLISSASEEPKAPTYNSSKYQRIAHSGSKIITHTHTHTHTHCCCFSWGSKHMIQENRMIWKCYSTQSEHQILNILLSKDYRSHTSGEQVLMNKFNFPKIIPRSICYCEVLRKPFPRLDNILPKILVNFANNILLWG